MKRYKELKYGDKTYTEQYKIDEILIKNGFDWFLECEVENTRIEILKDTLIFNTGVFFNGDWKYGVFRDGQWKYGTWEGGVWYNGTWYNGTFQNGLIFNGRFINGEIIAGEIRGGEFFDIRISDDVVKNIETPNKNSPKPQQGTQKIIQPESVQPQNITEKRIMRFNEGIFSGIKKFFKEEKDDDELGIKILDKLKKDEFSDLISQIQYYKEYNYQLILKKSHKENDPFDEEIDDENDLILKVTKSYGYNFPKIYLNDIELNINDKIIYDIVNIIKNKYSKSKIDERKNKIKKFKDLLDE